MTGLMCTVRLILELLNGLAVLVREQHLEEVETLKGILLVDVLLARILAPDVDSIKVSPDTTGHHEILKHRSPADKISTIPCGQKASREVGLFVPLVQVPSQKKNSTTLGQDEVLRTLLWNQMA